MRSLPLFVVGIAVGVGGARWSRPAPAAAPAPAPAPVSVPRLVCPPSVVVSRESPEPVPDVPEPDDAIPARAEQTVGAALVQGTWTVEDAMAFREELMQMTQAQREAAMSRLVVALNEGRLRAEPGTPIF